MLILNEIDITPLLKAYERLHHAVLNAKTELEKAGAIQYFEICYELSWKYLKRVLAYQGKEVNSPKPTFREAALEKLIDDPEIWFDFAKKRNLTVHTYDEPIADEIFLSLEQFDKEMQKLINHLKTLS